MWNIKSLSRALVLFASCWMLLVNVIGCNTVKGVGRDTERAGEKIQDAAEDAKH